MKFSENLFNNYKRSRFLNFICAWNLCEYVTSILRQHRLFCNDVICSNTLKFKIEIGTIQQSGLMSDCFSSKSIPRPIACTLKLVFFTLLKRVHARLKLATILEEIRPISSNQRSNDWERFLSPYSSCHLLNLNVFVPWNAHCHSLFVKPRTVLVVSPKQINFRFTVMVQSIRRTEISIAEYLKPQLTGSKRLSLKLYNQYPMTTGK